jgi:hypothetical protein
MKSNHQVSKGYIPPVGTIDHTLLTVLSLGVMVEVITGLGHASVTAAIRRLRGRGYVIRERVVTAPGREFNYPVYCLEGAQSPEVRDQDGLTLVVTLYDATSRATVKPFGQLGAGRG